MDNYRKDPRVSITELIKLINSPEEFKHVVLDKNKEESSSMSLGTLVHSIVLEPEKFNEEYYVSTLKAPEGMYAEMIKSMVNDYDILSDLPIQDEQVIMQYAVAQGISHKKDTVLKNFNSVKYLTYLSSLYAGKGKIIISQEELDQAHAMIDAIKAHPLASSYVFGTRLRDGLKIYFEQEIYWEVDGVEVKSKIDMLIVNAKEKKALELDLKTGIATNANQFKYSCKKYGYDKQAAFYTEAARYFLEHELGVTDYTVSHLIVNVCSAAPHQVMCCEFDAMTMAKAEESYLYALQQYKWRIKENKWYAEDVYEGKATVLNLTD